MALAGGSGTNLAGLTKEQIGKEAKKARFQLVTFLRIIGTIAEIGASIAFPELAPAILIGGASFQESLDVYTLLNTKPDRRSYGSFALTTLVNVLPTAAVLKSSYGAAKNIVRVADRRFADGFRYVVRGEEGFEEAWRIASSARVGEGSKFSRIRRIEARKLMQSRVIDPRRLGRDNAFEKALQKEFNEMNIQYSNVNGKQYVGNKDLAIMRKMAYDIHYKRAISIFDTVKRMTPEAQAAIGRLSYAKRFTGNAHKFVQRVVRASNMLKPQTIGQRLGRLFGGRRAYKITQTVQLFNPNDAAREMLNKTFNPVIRKMKKSIRAYFNKFSRWAKKQKGLAKVAGKALSALDLKLMWSIKQLQKHGTLLLDQEFLLGFRVIENNGISSYVTFLFNPLNTNAKTPGSKNFGGKKPVMTWVNNAHLEALKLSKSPGRMYLKGGSGFPPIAISAGGKMPVGIEVGWEFGSFMAGANLGAMRNALSLVSNAKNIAKDAVNGVYLSKWMPTFEDTFQRLLPHKIAKVLGAVAGAGFGRAMTSHTQRLALATARGFQHTVTETRWVNGKKITRRRTVFDPSKHYNKNTILKEALPISVRAQGLRRLPRGIGGSRSVGMVGARMKGQRMGVNARRVFGIPK